MGLNIKNAETERLIAELAQLEGRSKTAAVTDAVREKISRVRSARKDDLAERLLEIGRQYVAHCDPQTMAIDHGEYLYDENGLPK